jgi:hypothetical protein
MAKLVKVSDKKAYRIEGIQIGDQQMISVRQMYKTQRDPDTWKPGRTITLDIEVAARVGKHILSMANDDNTEFVEIEVQEREAKPAPRKKAKKRRVSSND